MPYATGFVGSVETPDPGRAGGSPNELGRRSLKKLKLRNAPEKAEPFRQAGGGADHRAQPVPYATGFIRNVETPGRGPDGRGTSIET